MAEIKDLLDSNYIVLLFYRDECDICTAIENMITNVISKYDDVNFYKLDSKSEYAQKMNIVSFPTVLFISHGDVLTTANIYNEEMLIENDVRRLLGMPPKDLTDKIANGTLLELDDNDIILHSTKKCVLFFSGTNDHDYITIRGILQDMSNSYSKQVVFGELDSEWCINMRKKFKVPKNQPTVVFIDNGNAISMIVNCKDEKTYVQEILCLVGS